ncbi:Ger(x)C family spore germination protein [Paenibacillus sp. FJAT-26967]|uniref:Ger(x)C family spore germination protein n=1 Tax=Paenibacillus sp. FJAT-26967 TaxID=1729690 RepID=UPI0008388E3E|nr:Ger(x)C family spore germination protein [Paenibacillus sp. FJAT-26967]
MKPNHVFLALILLAGCLVGGCNFKDIDKRVFVVSMGIDKGDGSDMRVSLKLAIPQGNPKEGAEEFEIIEEEARTISDALRKAKSKVDKELDYGHMKVLLIGEDMAREDIYRVINWAVRRRDIQRISMLGIGSPSALDAQKVKPKSERIPSNALILSLSKNGTESPFIVSEYLFDYQRRLDEKGLDPFLPVVEAEKDYFVINRVALMRKNKIAVELSPDETKIYNLLVSRNLKTNMSAQSENNFYEINLDNSRASYKIEETPRGAVLKYKIKISSNLEENEVREKFTRERLDEIEKIFEKEISRQVSDFLEKLQKNKTDPIGFGLRYISRHWNNETEWEEWERLFPALEFEVETHVRIHSAGTVH